MSRAGDKSFYSSTPSVKNIDHKEACHYSTLGLSYYNDEFLLEYSREFLNITFLVVTSEVIYINWDKVIFFALASSVCSFLQYLTCQMLPLHFESLHIRDDVF